MLFSSVGLSKFHGMTVGAWVGAPPRTQPLLWKEDVLSALSFQASSARRGLAERHKCTGEPHHKTWHCSLFHRRTADHIQGICSAVSARHVHDGTLTCLINAAKTQCDHGKSVSHIDVVLENRCQASPEATTPDGMGTIIGTLPPDSGAAVDRSYRFSSCLTGHRAEECHANGSDRERLHKKLFHGKWLLGYHMCTVFHFAVGWMALCAWPRVCLLNFIKKRKKGGPNLYLGPLTQGDGPPIRVPTASDIVTESRW